MIAARRAVVPRHEPVSVELRARVVPERIEHRTVVHVDADEHAVGDALRRGVVVVLGANHAAVDEELRLPGGVRRRDLVGVIGRQRAMRQRVPLGIWKHAARSRVLRVVRGILHHDLRRLRPRRCWSCRRCRCFRSSRRRGWSPSPTGTTGHSRRTQSRRSQRRQSRETRRSVRSKTFQASLIQQPSNNGLIVRRETIGQAKPLTAGGAARARRHGAGVARKPLDLGERARCRRPAPAARRRRTR